MKRGTSLLILLASLGFLMASCEREERGFRVQTPDANRIQSVKLSSLQPGEASPTPVMVNEYEKNALALAPNASSFTSTPPCPPGELVV